MGNGGRQVPFSSRAARFLGTISTFVIAVGTFLTTAQETPWDVNVDEIGLTLTWAGIIANFAVLALRSDAVPFLTSGVGVERLEAAQATTGTGTTEGPTTP